MGSNGRTTWPSEPPHDHGEDPLEADDRTAAVCLAVDWRFTQEIGSRSGWSTRWTPTTRCTTRSTSMAPAGSSSWPGDGHARAQPGLEGHRADPYRRDRTSCSTSPTPACGWRTATSPSTRVRDDVQLQRRPGGDVIARSSLHVVVVGGGQAGLAAASHLRRRGCGSWSSTAADGRLGLAQRWESLRLVHPAPSTTPCPAWSSAAAPTDPGKEAVAEYLHRLRADLRPAGGARSPGDRARRTDGGSSERRRPDVHRPAGIVATGPFQTPLSRRSAAGLDDVVIQLHSAATAAPPRSPGRARAGGGRRQLRLPDRRGARRHPAGRAAVGSAYPALPQRAARPGAVLVADPAGLCGSPSTPGSAAGCRTRETLIGTSRRSCSGPASGSAPRPGRRRRPTVRFADGTSREASVVVWATGYRPDYSWIDVPVVCRRSLVIPRRHRCPGLTSSACPGSTPAALRCWASSPTTRDTSASRSSRELEALARASRPSRLLRGDDGLVVTAD